MIRLMIHRLLAILPVLLVVTFAVFMLVSLLPGDPAVTLAGGQNATPESIAAIREQLHLNDPIIVQYATWLSGVVRGDLGESLLNRQAISDAITQRLPVTLGLTIAATMVSVAIGVPLGIAGGLWPGRAVDGIVRFTTSAGLAVPSFWLAIMLVLVFAVQFGWLPATGYVPFSESFSGWVKSIVMPAVALGLALSAGLARQLRQAIIDVMESNYIRTAWAKGASTPRVVIGHALKNAAIPAVTVLGVQVGYLLGGAVIVEKIFALPGLGNYLVQAIGGLDLPVVQGVVIVFVVFQLSISLLVDLTYGLLNPKVRVA